jgi:hypothetical protein
MPYANFDIELQPLGGGEYRAFVTAPDPCRGTSSEFALDLTVYADLRYKIEATRVGSQADVATDLQTRGSELYEKLFNGSLGTAFAGYKATHDQVRVRLSFTDTPELWQVPWEILYSPNTNQPMARSTNTSIVHRLSVGAQQQPERVGDNPLRLLVAASSVGGDGFDENTEIDSLLRVLQPHIDAGHLIVDKLATPTLSQFIECWTKAAIQKNPYRILHITGHGIYRIDSGFLVFSDGKGGVEHVGADRLAPLLANDPPHAIFLNLCEGATAGDKDAFSGVAQNLIRHSVPTVVGMQYRITNVAAEIFSERFYQVLSWGGDVESAVIRGREALFAANHLVEWVTPILLMQSESTGIGLVPPHAQLPQLMAEPIISSPAPTLPTPATVPLSPTPQPIRLNVQQIGELAGLALQCDCIKNDLASVLAEISWSAQINHGANLRATVNNIIKAASNNQDGWKQLDEAINLFEIDGLSYQNLRRKMEAFGLL